MSDANDSRSLRESDANPVREWLSVKEAAARLGVSERTVQKRADAGKVESRRDGRRLLIRVSVANQDANVREPDSSPSSPLVDALQAEVTFLRSQLEAKDRQIDAEKQEKADLLAVVSQQVRTIGEQTRQIEDMKAVPAIEAPQTTEKPRRGFLWWKRQGQ